MTFCTFDEVLRPQTLITAITPSSLRLSFTSPRARGERELLSIDPPRLLGQHDRNAVTDRISEFGRARDQFLFRRVIFERRFGQWADQDFEQFGIDALGWTIGHHQLQFNRRSKDHITAMVFHPTSCSWQARSRWPRPGYPHGS